MIATSLPSPPSAFASHAEIYDFVAHGSAHLLHQGHINAAIEHVLNTLPDDVLPAVVHDVHKQDAKAGGRMLQGALTALTKALWANDARRVGICARAVVQTDGLVLQTKVTQWLEEAFPFKHWPQSSDTLGVFLPEDLQMRLVESLGGHAPLTLDSMRANLEAGIPKARTPTPKPGRL